MEQIPQLSPVGFGDASCLLPASSPGASTFNTLPQATRCALLQNPPPGTADASAAVSLAQTISTGGVPTDAQVVAALGGIATLVAGPVAGAAMALAGGVVEAVSDGVQALLQALFPSHNPQSYNYCGYQRIGVDNVPWGPGDTQNWIPLARYQDLAWINGVQWAGSNPSPGGRPSVNPNASQQGSPAWSNMDRLVQICLFYQLSPQDRWAWDNGSWQNNVFSPSTATPPSSALSTDPRYRTLAPFEQYVLPLLVKDLAFWGNCKPFIPPQDLVAAAATAWNSAHSGGCPTDGSVCTGAEQLATCYRPSAANANGFDGSTDIVSFVLSGAGDPSGANQDHAPICVNAGSSRSNAIYVPGSVKINKTAAVSSAGTKVLVGTAVAAGATAVGIGIYAYLHKMAYKAVAQKLWDETGGKIVKSVRDRL